MNQNHLKNTFNIFENDYYAIIPSREAAKTPTSGKTFNFNLHNEQTQLFEQYNLNKDGKNFNFFNTSNKQPRKRNTLNIHDNQPLINEKNNVVVKNFNYTLNNVETYQFLNAHKETTKEKAIIQHPKQKIKGYRNPFVSQIKIK